MKITMWNGRYATAKTEIATDRAGFVKWLESAGTHPFPDKMACPLIGLGEYGDVRTESDALRSADNLRATWGVELDYDGADTTIDAAAERFRAAGVGAVLVTTATPGRWRAFLPSDRPLTIAERAEVAERANGVLGGSLASESFNAVQAWFVGAVAGVPYRVIDVPGALPLGRADLPRVGWKGGTREDGGTYTSTEALWGEIEDGNELHAAICALAYRGVSADELIEAVTRAAPHWSRPDAQKRLQQVIASDIPRAVKSAEAKRVKALEARLQALGPPPPQKPKRKLLASAADIKSRSGKPVFLIDGILEAGCLGLAFGPPAEGKSFLIMGMAYSIATGRDWQKRKVKPGGVVYVAGEGHAGIGRRLTALDVHHGVNDPNMPLHFTMRPVAFADAGAVEELQQEIDALPVKPVLIVIDTLARAGSGLDLDKGRDMGLFVRACDSLRDRYGAAVLVVHHSGHSTGDRAMNSIALKGAVDWEVGVKREGDDMIRVTNSKSKDASAFPDLFLRFQEVQLPPSGGPDTPEPAGSSVVLVECEAAPTPGKGPRTSKWAVLLLETIRNAGGTISATQARDTFVELSDAKEETARRAFYQACDRAIANGLVRRDDATGALSTAF